MALSEFEIRRIEKLVGRYVEAHRPDPSVRAKLDLAFRIDKQSFVIYEIRPQWDNPKRKLEYPAAKATYVKSRKLWKLYWMRADLKWHRYPPLPESKSLETILDEIERDPHGCFYG